MSPSRTADFYCQREGRIEGPYTRDELKFLAARGRLAPDDAVREGTNGSWTTAQSIGVIFPTQEQRPQLVGAVSGRVRRRPADQRPDADNLSATNGQNQNGSPTRLTDADFSGAGTQGDYRESQPKFTRKQKLFFSITAILLVIMLGLLIWWLLSRPSGAPAGGGAPGHGADQGAGPEKPTAAADSTGSGKQKRDPVPSKPPATSTPPKLQKVKPAPPNASGGAGTASSGRYAIGGGRFFGVQAKGSRFVYVVDCSGSMAGARLETVKQEILRSVHALWPAQQFYVIFFSDKAYPMFTPQRTAPMLLPAKPENLRRAQHWVTQFSLSGGTDPTDAMVQALGLRPDAIFLLTDGEFDPSVVETIRKRNKHRIVINTIGFKNSAGEALLRRIASENGGGYRFVR